MKLYLYNMKAVKDDIELKKKFSKLFPHAVINNDLKKYADSPVILKKVEEAKKFLANFGYK